MSTVLVTGANRGIGLELCRQFTARGARVIAVCRSSSQELKDLNPSKLIEGVDVSKEADVSKLAAAVGGDSIDVLVNNAGILLRDKLDAMDYAGILRQIEVNSIAPLRVTDALQNHLHAGSKVVVITSRMGSVGDNTSGGYYGYRMSKAAVNAAFKSLSIDLKPRGIPVGIFHPGMVETDMLGGPGVVPGSITPEESVKGLVARIDELSMDSTGKFYHMNGSELPW
eukprot:GILJ01003183.1.p1 GENE.GILJ01003183.1~~GILJ01003183.1.p1  ORF type:complete len:240 (+),score=39.66 GILJ01003183.1:44-721(+)